MTVISELLDRSPELFRDHQPEFVIREFDTVDSRLPYHFVPPKVSEYWRSIQESFGPDGPDTFNRATLLTLLGDFDRRAAALTYTPAILECFEHSLQRIRQKIESTRPDVYSKINDRFLKDLGICRHRLFPAGAAVMERNSAFHRSLLWRRGLAQAWAFGRLLAITRGNWPCYQVHLNMEELAELTPPGTIRLYLRVAGMLALEPHVKSMWAGAWLYDPVLRGISPNLAYIQDIPRQGGAQFFYSAEDKTGNPLARSKTRKALWEQGKYSPRAYVMVWPREALLSWARSTPEPPPAAT